MKNDSKIEIRDLAKSKPEAKHLRVSSSVRAGMSAAGVTCSPCADDCGVLRNVQ
jgi:hypothetical protein